MAILSFSNATRPARRATISASNSETKVIPIEEYRGVVLLPRRSASRAATAPSNAEPKTFDAA